MEVGNVAICACGRSCALPVTFPWVPSPWGWLCPDCWKCGSCTKSYALCTCHVDDQIYLRERLVGNAGFSFN